jgi:hypothetical protein
MLVLVAVYRSKLYQYLPSDTRLTPKNLDALFKRTIQALDRLVLNHTCGRGAYRRQQIHFALYGRVLKVA